MALVVGSPELRAEVLRVMHKLTLGMGVLATDDLHGQRLSPAELGLAAAAGEDDVALLNALLEVEHEQRERDFATLERLLTLTQFEDGPLDGRLSALPERSFVRAVLDLYELGWVS